MAIRLVDYSKIHARSVRRIWFAAVALSTGIFFLMIFLATHDISSSLLFCIPFFVLQMAVVLTLLPFTLAPLDILARAVTHVSGQVSDVVPPNVNGTRHEKTGLKLMVETIYRLATQSGGLIPGKDKAMEKEKTMVSLLHELPFGVIALDSSYKIVYSNKTAPVTTNEKGEESIKLLFEKAHTFEAWIKHASEHSISESKLWPHIQSALPGEPNRKVYDVFAQYNGNDVSGIETVVIAIDRTDNYLQTEDEMDFISLAAHELRGPITVIHGYLDVLQDEMRDTLQPDQVALFERLRVSASRLTGYINNILNVARYDRRHLKLSLQEDTLSDIWTMIEGDINLRASTQNRLLQVNIPANLPTIAADRNSLSEVMANLIDNGIKYSREGGLVQISAAVDGNYVKCSVQDSGIGMPAQVVNGLFTKFYRSHRSSQSFTGTGLGLYISKAIVESHGGSIGVRSKEGDGSIFTFSIPIYSTVADKLLANNNSNQGIINSGGGWIKNHAMFKG